MGLGPFRLHHLRERGRQGLEPDRLARLVQRPVRLQPEPLVVRPRLHEPQVRLDGAGREEPQGEPVLGVLDGAGRDLLEAHRAPALQDGQRAVQRARYDGRVETLAEEVAPARLVPLDAGALRGPALGDDGGDLALGGRVHQNQRLSAQPVQVLLDDPADEQRGDPRVERVAALHEGLEGGGRRQGVPGGETGGASRHRRALRLQRRGEGDGQSDQQTDDPRPTSVPVEPAVEACGRPAAGERVASCSVLHRGPLIAHG